MKKSEAYIEKISKEFRLSPTTAKLTYEAIFKYDMACFCSYMALYSVDPIPNGCNNPYLSALIVGIYLLSKAIVPISLLDN